MIGESRADSKLLNMAAAASRRAASKNAPEIAESDFLAKELDSPANAKVRPSSLKERAAAISAGISEEAKKKAQKAKDSKVAKDASSHSDKSSSGSVSRVTRRQANQHGGPCNRAPKRPPEMVLRVKVFSRRWRMRIHLTGPQVRA